MYPPIKITTLMMFSFLLHPTISYSTDEDALIVKILSPQNGQTVAQTFEVNYKINNGKAADPIDVFLDGVYQKGFTGKLENIPPGKHELLIKAITVEHDNFATWDRIEIMVQ